MGVLHCEGFEANKSLTWLARLYDGNFTNSNFLTGRLHGFGWNMGSTDELRTKSLGAQTEVVVGVAINHVNATAAGLTTKLLQVLTGVNEQVRLDFVGSGGGTYQLKLMRGATQLAISGPIATQAWVYVELYVKPHTSTGAYELRLDEVSTFSGSGVNTANAGTNGCDVVAYFGPTGAFNIDDQYIVSGSSFLGSSVVEPIYPSADTATADWLLSSGGTGYTLILDDPIYQASHDTTYIYLTAATGDSLFSMTDVGVITGAVHALSVVVTAFLASMGTRQMAARISDGTNTSVGSTQTVTAVSPGSFRSIFDTKPAGGSWSTSDVNGILAGVRGIS